MLSPQVTDLIVAHLEALEGQFGKYFSEAELHSPTLDCNPQRTT